MGKYIEEVDHLLELNPTTEVRKYDDEDALQDRIFEWLETPQGTMADLPGWGHNLAVLKHEPQGVNLNVVAEMSIMTKMPQDIENLVIQGVSVEFSEIDLCKIVITHRLGVFEEKIEL
jgi:phage baseplate assembly protein W